MATIKHFTELRSWQEARTLNKMIFEQILNNPDIRDFELKNQLNGAAGSVMDNIAEGFGRGGTKEFVQFIGFSLGSLSEVESQLYRALDRNYIKPVQQKELFLFTDKVRAMLISFSNYLRKSDYRGAKYKAEEPEGIYHTPDKGEDV